MTLVPPIKYHGGKNYLAKRIIGLMPPRCKNPNNPDPVDPGWLAYCEPYFGGGAVLLNLDPEGISEVVNDIDGDLCLGPSTRILGGDLRWVRIGDISVGDSILAFDESNGPAREGFRAPTSYRRWRIGSVTAKKFVNKPCYRLVFDDGAEVVASADHQWLGGSSNSGRHGWRWIATKNMICCERRRSWVMKSIEVTEQESSFEAGWIGGFSDGEGNFSKPPGWNLTIHQKVGPEADRAQKLLEARGYAVVRSERVGQKDGWKTVASLNVNGGMRDAFRFFMQFRPERLIRDAIAQVSARSVYGMNHHAVGLVKKEPLGVREVVALETTTRTYIAEGLASHNCNFWSAIRSPERFEKFRRTVEAMPFSHGEWKDAGDYFDPQCQQMPLAHDMDARAVAFFVRCRQSLAGRMDSFAPLSRNRTRRGMNEQASAWLNAVGGLPAVHQRLKRVVILNEDGVKAIRSQDGPRTLHYIDCPYLATTVASPDVYRYGMTDDQHRELLATILDCKGKVMISGYPSEMYDSALKGWERHQFSIANNAAGGPTKERMKEVLWLNYKTF